MLEPLVLERMVLERMVLERMVLEHPVLERMVLEHTVVGRTVLERLAPKCEVLERTFPKRLVPERTFLKHAVLQRAVEHRFWIMILCFDSSNAKRKRRDSQIGLGHPPAPVCNCGLARQKKTHKQTQTNNHQ